MSWREGVAKIAGGRHYAAKGANNVYGSDNAEMKSYFSDNGAANFNFYDGTPQSNFSLGQITEGRAPLMAKMLEQWTLFEDANIFTALLPIVKTDSLKIRFDKVTYLPTIAQRTAERARPRTVESKRQTISDVLERSAIGLELNYAMLTTPEGKEHFTMGLAQMRMAVEEANALNVLNELMTCFSPWRTFERRYETKRGRSLKDILDDEAFFFAIFQRVDGAFQMLDTRISHLQRYYRGKGNTYVLHRKLIQYNTQVPEAQTQYWIGGPEAVARFNKGAQGVTTDGRGNVLVTVDTYQVENMKPLDPLKRYITYGEYNEFRDLKRGGDYKNHYDSHRHIGIYNVDDDQWSIITTEYVIDNCCRFDEQTGEPLGMNHSRVARHDVQYQPHEMLDTYHYTAKRGSETVLLPIRYMGQFDLSHITLSDILNIADVANEKMVDLNSKYTNGDVKKIVEGGMEVLRYIESLAYDGAAEEFIIAVRDLNARLYPGRTRGGRSAFAPNYDTDAFNQNIHSGWDLPAKSDAWSSHQAPFGYGSAAGFLTIAHALSTEGSPAAFQAKYGFSGEMAQKVSNFVTLLQDYVSYLQTYFPMSPALEAVCAAPWWHHPTAVHTLWDTVIVQQYRLPYHVLNVSLESAPASVDGGGNAARLAAITDRSKAAREFLSDHLLGRMTTQAQDQGRGAALIAAYLGSEDAGGRNLVYDKFQRQSSAAADGKSLVDRLPKFAQVRLSQAAAGGLDRSAVDAEGLPLRVVVNARPGKPRDDKEAVDQAYDLLVALVHGTATDLTSGDNLSQIVARETARALITSVLSFIKIDDLKGRYDLGAASSLAGRILFAIDDLIVPAGLSVGALLGARGANDETIERLLDGFDSTRFIENFKAKVRRALDGSSENPYRISDSTNLDTTVAFLARTVQIGDQLSKELRNGGFAAGASAAKHNPADYLSSPLLYSPSQLVQHFADFVSKGKTPVALPASTEVPAQPMDAASEADQARAIEAFRRSPTKENLHRVRPELVPAGTVRGTAVNNNPILAHINRARLYADDKARAKNIAAQDQVGGSPYSKAAMEVDPSFVHQQRVSGSGAAATAARASLSSGDQRDIKSRFGARGAKRTASEDSSSSGKMTAHAELQGKRQRQFGGVDPSLPEMLLTGNFITSWNAVDENGSRGVLNNWTAKTYLLTPFNAKVLKNWATHNLVVPIRALLFRFAVLGTYSIIKMQAGAETGHTYIGNSIFSWNNDGLNQVYYSQFDYYIKAKVEELANVFQADNVYVDEYLGGFGNIPVGWADQTPVYLAGEANTRKPSVYISLEPYANPLGSYPSKISVTGLQRDAFGRYNIDMPTQNNLDFPNAAYFNMLYGHQEAVNRDRVAEGSAAENANFEPGSSPVIAHAGATRYYSQRDQEYSLTSVAQGFFPTEWYGKGLLDLLSGKLTRAPNHPYNALVK